MAEVASLRMAHRSTVLERLKLLEPSARPPATDLTTATYQDVSIETISESREPDVSSNAQPPSRKRARTMLPKPKNATCSVADFARARTNPTEFSPCIGVSSTKFRSNNVPGLPGEYICAHHQKRWTQWLRQQGLSCAKASSEGGPQPSDGTAWLAAGAPSTVDHATIATTKSSGRINSQQCAAAVATGSTSECTWFANATEVTFGIGGQERAMLCRSHRMRFQSVARDASLSEQKERYDSWADMSFCAAPKWRSRMLQRK